DAPRLSKTIAIPVNAVFSPWPSSFASTSTMLPLLFSLLFSIFFAIAFPLFKVCFHFGIATGTMHHGRQTAVVEIESLHMLIPMEMQLTDFNTHLYLRDEGKAGPTNPLMTGSATSAFFLLELPGITGLYIAVAVAAGYIVLRSVF